MLPTLVSDLPEGDEWRYEVKYDGYRATLHITEDRIDLISRNLHSFNGSFPDVIEGVEPLVERLDSTLPLVFDGELCILASDHKANFEIMQVRGRMRSQRKITEWAKAHRADYLAFDLLEEAGENLRPLSYSQRKQRLQELFLSLDLPPDVDCESPLPFHYVPSYDDGEKLWQQVKAWDSEGVVAKKISSIWMPGKRTHNWLKIKNWKTATFFLTAYDKESNYFHVAVLRDGKPYAIGVFSHGLEGNERTALIDIMRKNRREEATEETTNVIMIEPSICVDLEFTELYKEGLRQPRFKAFRFDKNWEECTWEAVLKSVANSISTGTP